jgi:fatty-acyl-CoA synthase
MSQGAQGEAVAGKAYVKSVRPNLAENIAIGDLLRRAAADSPNARALALPRDPATGVQRVWTFLELLEKSEAAARALLELFTPGDRVAIWASNRPEWVFAQFGAALAGLVVVAANPACKPHELSYILRQSRASGIIFNRSFRGVDCEDAVGRIAGECPDLKVRIVLDDWSPIQAKGRVDLPRVDPMQPAMIQYTSGTTGKPKGALLSHHGLVNTTKSVEHNHELARGSVWLGTAPMYTTSGSVFTVLTALWNRGVHVMLPQFEAGLVLRAIAEDRVDWAPLVPTMALAVLDHPAFAASDLSSLKIVVMGGSPIAPDLVRRIEREMGVDMVIVFGQTESSSALCMTSRVDTMEHRTTTIGYPLGGIELQIVEPETNNVLDFGAIGEICVRGHSVMLGYFNMPEESAKALDAEGWLHTGDLGYMNPDGYPQITGRLKDMIIRGGTNIYPREIEDILAAMPGVINAAVFGVPDAKYGEIIVAAVRAREDGPAVTAESVKAFVAERLARYKTPSHVWFVDEFPMTAVGKIQKFELRDRFVATILPQRASA